MLQLTDTYKLSKSHPKPAQISPILIKLLSCSCLLHLRDKPSQSQPPLLQQRSGTNKPPHADPRALPELAKTRWPHHRQSTPAAGAKLRLQVRISLFFSTFAKPKASPASHAVLRVPFLLPRFCTPTCPTPRPRVRKGAGTRVTLVYKVLASMLAGEGSTVDKKDRDAEIIRTSKVEEECS